MWWIIGTAAAVVLLVLACTLVASRRNHQAVKNCDVGPTPALPDRTGPTSVLELVYHTLSSKEHTTNASALLTSSSKAVVRIVLSLGFVLMLIAGAIIGLALLLASLAGPGAAITGGIAIGGAGAAWAGSALWRRFSITKPSRQARSTNRRRPP